MMVAKSKALREYDLSVAQYAAMLSLYYAPGQSAAQLARAAAVPPQTMATVLARLEAKKLNNYAICWADSLRCLRGRFCPVDVRVFIGARK